MAKFKDVNEATEAYEKLNSENDSLAKNLAASEKKLAAAEKKADGLLSENNNQASELKKVEKRSSELETDNSRLNNLVFDQDKKLDEAKNEISAKNSEIADLNALVEELRNSKSNGSTLGFTHEGKDYQITAAKFKHAGKEYKASQLVANKQLQAELIELGAGFIQEVKDEEEEEEQED